MTENLTTRALTARARAVATLRYLATRLEGVPANSVPVMLQRLEAFLAAAERLEADARRDEVFARAAGLVR